MKKKFNKMLILCSLFMFFAVSFLLAGGEADKEKSTKEVTLTIPMLEWPPTTITKELTNDFEEKTGIKVRYDILPWEPLHEKLTLELASGSSTYDVVSIDNQWTGELIRGGHLMPLPWQEWRDDQEFDYGDLIPAFIEAYGAPFGKPGEVYVMPFATDAPMVFYRKDLFNDPKHQAEFQRKYGRKLQPPTTWTEYLEIANYFTMDRDGDGSIDLYGTTIMGARGDALASDVRVYIYGFGGNILDENLKPVLNDEMGIKAIQFYVDLYRTHKVVSPASTTYGYDEVLAALQMDKVAMMENWQTFWPSIQDPESSKVVGKVSAVMLPKLPNMRESRSNLGGFGLAISTYTKKKEESIAYIKWFLSKETQLEFARRGGTAARFSAFNDSQVLDSIPYADQYVKAMKQGIPVLSPVLPEFTEIDNIYAEEVSKALTGSVSVKECLDRAASRIENLLREKGYY